MKVLIIDGSNPITWYYGLEGKVFPITHIKDAHYFVLDEAIPFIDTSCGPCGVHFPDGLLLYTEDEFNQINQELLQRREEVKQLMIERDDCLVKIERLKRGWAETSKSYGQDRKEHMRREIKLRKDIQALKEQLELPRKKPDKVAIPMEVADAISNCTLAGLSRITIITSFDHVNSLFRDYSPEVIASILTIRNYAYQTISGSQNLLEALVNGYTIEEPEPTPEERVINYFNIITPEGWNFNGDANDPVYIARDAIRTTCSMLGKEIKELNGNHR